VTAFVTRFAPSPTGHLHRGHAFSALTASTAAQRAGGRFLLRIEDTDFTRCRPQFERALQDDLAWLGLSWETPVRRQSEHVAEYAQALARLQELRVLYRCFRTRREVLALSAGAPHADDPVDAQRLRAAPSLPLRRRSASPAANRSPGACRSPAPNPWSAASSG
jgi:glutamyl-Q tRNA(Asp) synthetase